MTVSRVILADVVDFQTGFPFKSKDYSQSGEGLRLLRGDNIGQGFLRWENAKLWPEPLDPDLSKYHLRENDVVLAMDRPWIEAGLKYSALSRDDLPAFLVQRVARFRGTTALDERFLRYLIGSAEFTRHIHEISTGSVVPHISGRDILTFEFDLPSIKEQGEIAAVLGALDDKIELNRKTAVTLEEMARALYRSWFVDFDPVQAKSEGRAPAHMSPATAALFPDSFGDDGLPEGWVRATVADLCEKIFSGGTPRTSDASFWHGGIPWLSSGETRQSFVIETEKTITEAGVAGSSTRFAREGATVIASAGQGKTRGQASFLAIDSYVNQSVIACEGKPEEIPDVFLFYDLERRYEEFRSISDANSSRGSLTTKLVGMLECVIPSRNVLAAFENEANPMLQMAIARTRENQTLATLRDTLLPHLMSGELRVSEAREQVEEVA